MLNWKAKPSEIELIAKIAERAEQLALEVEVQYSYREAMMDIQAAHCNGCPLRLKELLAARDFGHDVFGIRKHLNRSTGKLDGIFWPRYAVNQ